MNVVLINHLGVYPEVGEHLRSLVPGLYVTENFEQVYGMVKCKEVDKLCIYLGGWNYSKNPSNIAGGQEAAEDIHKINPSIPILIWSGRIKDVDPPVRYPNEIYLDLKDYKEFYPNTEKFFTGTLTWKDIPIRECIADNFLWVSF